MKTTASKLLSFALSYLSLLVVMYFMGYAFHEALAFFKMVE